MAHLKKFSMKMPRGGGVHCPLLGAKSVKYLVSYT